MPTGKLRQVDSPRFTKIKGVGTSCRFILVRDVNHRPDMVSNTGPYCEPLIPFVVSVSDKCSSLHDHIFKHKNIFIEHFYIEARQASLCEIFEEYCVFLRKNPESLFLSRGAKNTGSVQYEYKVPVTVTGFSTYQYSMVYLEGLCK